MTAEDDKALSWDGDDDVAVKSARPTKPAKSDATSESAGDTPPATSGSFLLITYGILGGVYLIYTIGWLVTVFNDNRKPFDDFLTEFMYQVGEYLAIASPVLWFVTALLLTRGRKPIVRLLALLLGAVAVIPWPFVLLGALHDR